MKFNVNLKEGIRIDEGSTVYNYIQSSSWDIFKTKL